MATFVPQNDIVGPGAAFDTTYPNFGIYAYKNQQGGVNVPLSQHISSFVEMGVGAHYYAQGELSSAYSSAEATVDLKQVKLNLAGRRVACICLNFIGTLYKGGCDMGIENRGAGWFCAGYSPNAGPDGWGDSGPVRPNATKCTLKISVTGSSSENKIVGTFTWYNESGEKIATDTLTCYAEGNPLFVMSGGGPYGRFTRFMSLIPDNDLAYTPQNDYADGSYMTGGNFSNVKIYSTAGASYAWTGARFEYIWSAQGWNISECSVGGSTDRFSLAHENNVYA